MLLLSRLTKKLLPIYENRFTINSVSLWSDSQIALFWITSHASRWTVFVANRVSQIQELTTGFKWYYVKSSENPADLPSRGMLPQDVLNCEIWWCGPSFLKNPNLDISEFAKNPVVPEISEERKISLVTTINNRSVCLLGTYIFKIFNFL